LAAVIGSIVNVHWKNPGVISDSQNNVLGTLLINYIYIFTKCC